MLTVSHLKKEHLPTEWTKSLPIKPGLGLSFTSLLVDSQLLCRNWSRSPNLHEKESPRTEDPSQSRFYTLAERLFEVNPERSSLSSVMAPSGPVLLLLLSSFLTCSLSGPPRSDLQENRALQKRGKTADNVKAAAKDLLEIVNAVKPFIGLIPDAGSYLTSIIDFANVIAGKNPEQELLDYLKLKFDDLNVKIDKNQKEIVFNIWKSTEYAELEKKITIAWNKLGELLKGCGEPCFENLKKDGKDKIIENDFKKAGKYVDELHYNIVGKGAYKANYEELLKDHVRCDERRLKIFSAVNALLVHKAITMTNFYNLFMNIKTDEDALANKARDISAAMFEIHKNCTSEPDPYVKLDILDLIKESEQRKDLAKNIREYLDKTFYHYDWMVVAFKTKSSNHKSVITKWLDRHILTGFTAVEKGKTSVAFAKQAKGSHRKTAQVVDAIKKCYNNPVPCDQVRAKLESCANVKGTYSAIHAFIHKEHGSVHALEAEEAPTEEEFDPEEQQTVPYLYTGKCTMSVFGKGEILPLKHFRVLIKSDEEWMNESPCKGVDCGGKERGKCVEVKNARIGLCECEKKYYGENCEKTMEDYKKKVFVKEIQKPPESMG
ncbi:uncharacterized protein LOC107833180 [Poecilia formosa]|uniref:uncharacterized protein LOC107833180 n=1 Tax=Poecilia formosa TaxID=48698 RepID=UPI0007B83F62|nr:PREDICTED: uncharacterized protein LOC107833180 [Poecilia formosa]